MLQRLNLVPPEAERPSVTPAPGAGPGVSPDFPPPNPEALKEIERRKDLIVKSGQVPEWIFFCGVAGKLLTLRPGEGKKPSVLLFMTPYAAQDYLRATKVAGQVMQMKFDSLPGFAQTCAAAGADSFVLNFCPRCRVGNAIALQAMREKDKLVLVWATRRAIQLYQAGNKFLEFVRCQKDFPRARAALEMIRDHLDCGIPYLHELIAAFAHLAPDEAVKAEAIERLKEFGPQFADWESRWNVASSPAESSSFSKSLAIAMLGLGQNCGIELKPPPNQVDGKGP